VGKRGRRGEHLHAGQVDLRRSRTPSHFWAKRLGALSSTSWSGFAPQLLPPADAAARASVTTLDKLMRRMYERAPLSRCQVRSCSARADRAVVSTCKQGRSSVAINVPAPREPNALW
jgi:hypothetical protein